MLVALARAITDRDLPEFLCESTTFTEVEGSPSRSRREEDDLAMSLKVKIDNEASRVEGQDVESKN